MDYTATKRKHTELDTFFRMTDAEHPLSLKEILKLLKKESIETTRQTLKKDINELIYFGFEIEFCIKSKRIGYVYWYSNREFELS